MNSNRLFMAAAVVATVVGLGGGWWAAQPDHSISQYDRLGAEIGCQCGTCPLRPIATCGCAFADGMLTELAELTDGSRDDGEVMATFVSRYNETVRIKPAAEGFDLLAWIAPMLLLAVGAVGVGAIVTRWVSMRSASEPEAVSAQGSADAEAENDDARAIVERELADLER